MRQPIPYRFPTVEATRLGDPARGSFTPTGSRKQPPKPKPKPKPGK